MWNREPTRIQSSWFILWSFIVAIILFPFRTLIGLFQKDFLKGWKPVQEASSMLFAAKATTFLCLLLIVSYIVVILAGVEHHFVMRPGDLVQETAYRVVTHLFFHASWTHLLGNLIVLFGVGRIVERFFGPGWLLSMFIGFGAVAGALTNSVEMIQGVVQGSVGASAAISGLAVISLLRSPFSLTISPPLVLPIFLVVPAYIVSDLTLLGTNTNVGHMAHIFGTVAGLAFAIGTAGRTYVWKRLGWILLLFLCILGVQLFI